MADEKKGRNKPRTTTQNIEKKKRDKKNKWDQPMYNFREIKNRI